MEELLRYQRFRVEEQRYSLLSSGESKCFEGTSEAVHGELLLVTLVPVAKG